MQTNLAISIFQLLFTFNFKFVLLLYHYNTNNMENLFEAFVEIFKTI